ncbi:aldehyde dehydrogenase-like protein [Xylariaceae sp. FL0255]|nr:aldehyde dehydrogenase-like protein [Xylariaceae sp. FL0255]
MPATITTNGDTKPVFYNVIDGKGRESDIKEQVTDPRTEELLWDVPIASSQDLDDAVEAARRAFKTWRMTTQEERHKILLDVAAVIREQQSLLADIHAKETGKSIDQATSDVVVAAMHFEYYSNITLEDEIQYEDSTVTIIGTPRPIGVLAAISPWNFPMILSSSKIASALTTGNCVLIKPSPFTPYAMLKFCEVVQSVLPPGVFQALAGGADLGEAMTLHPGIDHISFTGTLAVGQRIMRNCAATMKRVILEMAGNNAVIVLPDADLSIAVPAITTGCFFHAGQVCVASKRIYVHESLYDEFLKLFIEESKKYFPNNEDPANLFSPLSNRVNYERAVSFLEDCRKNRLEIVEGADFDANAEKGFWMKPIIVKNPPEDSLLVREEQFAPIAPIMSWSDEDDVISRANTANSGLGAGIYTTDMAEARRLAARIESGSVWINRYERPHFGAFFGGWGLSGFGGELGKRGLYNYCQMQSLHIRKL